MLQGINVMIYMETCMQQNSNGNAICNLQFNKSWHYAIDNSLCNLIMQFVNTLFKVYFNMQIDNEILNKICKSYNNIRQGKATLFI